MFLDWKKRTIVHVVECFVDTVLTVLARQWLKGGHLRPNDFPLYFWAQERGDSVRCSGKFMSSSGMSTFSASSVWRYWVLDSFPERMFSAVLPPVTGFHGYLLVFDECESVIWCRLFFLLFSTSLKPSSSVASGDGSWLSEAGPWGSIINVTGLRRFCQ